MGEESCINTKEAGLRERQVLRLARMDRKKDGIIGVLGWSRVLLLPLEPVLCVGFEEKYHFNIH
jgi:hypothetical protein